jgi:beta-N-acetylhexosaminidase
MSSRPGRLDMRRRSAAAAATLVLGTTACSGLTSGDAAGQEPGGQRALPTTPSAAPSGAAEAGASTVTPAPPAPELRCATKAVAGMDVREQAGQVLLVGAPAGRPDRLASTAARYHLGGVFLQGRTTASASSIAARLDTLGRQVRRGSALPLLVAVDQEGGAVQTLTGRGFSRIPSATDQGRLPLPRLSRLTDRWAGELAKAGISMNLAPVADTVPKGTAGNNPPIGEVERHLGTDPRAVAARVDVVAGGLRSARVLPTVKHFPGLGRVTANTDRASRVVDRTTDADDPALAPFRAGAKAGAAVMMSSAVYARIDPSGPAAFSPAAIQLLRRTAGEDVLAVSDDLGAAQAVRDVPIGQRALRFVAAGGDLVLTVDPADVPAMTSALVRRASTERRFQARLTEAATRVVTAKASLGLIRCDQQP